MSPKIIFNRGGGRRNGFSPPPEMFWRHPKMSSSTQECDVPPKNVWLPRRDGLAPPESVLGPPKKVWGAQIVSWPAREFSEIAGLGSAGFSKRTHHDGIGTPKMREF